MCELAVSVKEASTDAGEDDQFVSKPNPFHDTVDRDS